MDSSQPKSCYQCATVMNAILRHFFAAVTTFCLTKKELRLKKHGLLFFNPCQYSKKTIVLQIKQFFV